LYVPLAFIAAVPALVNEVIVLNEKYQVAAAFYLFLYTVYNFGGPAISSAINDIREGLRREYHEVDENLLSGFLMPSNFSKSTISPVVFKELKATSRVIASCWS